MEETVRILKLQQILYINRRLVETFGGLYIEADNNLANPGSLEYVLEEVQGSLFGQKLYPTAAEQASIICWKIIAGHIFHDGNKRTGLEVCRIILEMNRYLLEINEDLLEVSLQIAKSEMSQEEYIDWIQQHISNIESS
jgi:death on curing protein